jgi:sulfur-carrier protein adenylyltransferase/sulfurtransferase
MEPQEQKRYSRQIIMPEIGLSGQEKLKSAKVLMIGAGGLGCPVLQYLVAAGVGTIGIIDDDRVDVTNLHRQILYSPADIGKNKALIAAEKLSVFNPFVNLIAIDEKLTEKNAHQVIADYDLVIDGSDNFPTRYLANDICVLLDKPMVFGSILKFEGQVSVFNFKDGPTYRCLFPEAEEGDNCETAGVLGILPGIIGTYMANEVVKIICETGEPLSGKLLVINVLDNTNRIFHFNRSFDKSTSDKITNLTPKKHPELLPDQMLMKNLEILLETEPEKLHLIDVREEYEYEEDFLGGINIPLPDLPENLSKMPADKTIVFYCASGKRSKTAVALLKKSGFTGESFWAKKDNH